MAEIKRVYHPTLNAWQDVPEKDAKNWKDAGWRLTKPDHIDDSDAPGVGEHPGFAQVPVLEDTSPTVTTATAGGAATTTSAPAPRQARPPRPDPLTPAASRRG